MIINKVKAICIKSYKEEDDVDLFDAGKIEEEDIHEYQVGEEGMVVLGYYNKEYWKLAE